MQIDDKLTGDVVRGPGSWSYIYIVLGFLVTIESTVIGMMTPLCFPWNIAAFLAIAVLTIWAFLECGWLHNKLMKFKSRYENKPR